MLFIIHFNPSRLFFYVLQSRGGQIVPTGHVVRHSVFSGPRKHSGKSSNLKYPPTRHNKRQR